ncbi:MAG: Hpt domain-containing protein [Bacteroidota bacterium]
MKKKPEKLYDLKELRIIAESDELFFHEMIALFISQNETAMQEIRNYTASGNFAKVKAILHKMKPSLMVMGVCSIVEIIQQLEKLELSPANEPLFINLLQSLEAILLEVNSQFRMI